MDTLKLAAMQDVTLLVHAAAITHRGNVRKNNEDAFVVMSPGGSSVRNTAGDVASSRPTTPLVLAVSDGMGGAAAGEIASAITIDAFCRTIPGESRHWPRSLERAGTRANSEVRAAARSPELSGMGATLTAACIHDGVVDLAHVGDSRAYLFRGRALQQLTRDQTYVQQLIDEGKLDLRSAKESQFRNILNAAIGGSDYVRIALGRALVLPGDVVLICSDGLTNELTDTEIADALGTESSPDAMCAELVRRTLARTARDNVTILAAKISRANP